MLEYNAVEYVAVALVSTETYSNLQELKRVSSVIIIYGCYVCEDARISGDDKDPAGDNETGRQG